MMFRVAHLKQATTFVRMAVITCILCSGTSCGNLIKTLTNTYADHFSICFCYKGQWSAWEKEYFKYAPLTNMNIYCHWSNNGDIIGLSLKDCGGNVFWTFQITNYVKGKEEYSGTVSYYVNDYFPTAEATAKVNMFVKPDYRTETTPSVKRTARAKIRIVQPDVFNIWYDNIGVGIDVRNVYWK